MEYEHEKHNVANRGVANTALGLGIGAVAAEVLGGGSIGNILGGRTATCNEDHLVNRYEAAMQNRISELETEVKLRDANTFTMGEVGKLREYFEGKFDCVNHRLNEQGVYNATLNGTVSCIQGQIAQLASLTKNVIPITSICPQPAVATTTTTT